MTESLLLLPRAERSRGDRLLTGPLVRLSTGQVGPTEYQQYQAGHLDSTYRGYRRRVPGIYLISEVRTVGEKQHAATTAQVG